MVTRLSQSENGRVRCGDGEADVPAAGVALDGCVEELLGLGHRLPPSLKELWRTSRSETTPRQEGDDLVELAADLCPGHAQDGAVEEDVFSSSQFGMKAGPHLQQTGPVAESRCNSGTRYRAGHPAAHDDLAFGRRSDLGKDLEQGALAGAVPADLARRSFRAKAADADGFALLDGEGDVFEGPEILCGLRIADW